MYWSILADYFIKRHDDDFNVKEKVDQDKFIIESTEELKKFINHDNLEEIEHFKYAIINHMRDLESDHLTKAIHFGVLCGMEIKEMILKFEGAL